MPTDCVRDAVIEVGAFGGLRAAGEASHHDTERSGPGHGTGGNPRYPSVHRVRGSWCRVVRRSDGPERRW
ncbi:Uncharacterised protein [Mycobacteroides abscessus subsp. abscessus]|nr:Uncharacterised protein [Mycobacteroides abscessus subsp. abscessus]